MVKFSIIIPVYNVERYLHQCIQSVINQSFKNFEIILVDDGSTDTSPNICDIYSIKDDRITTIHKKNGGLSDARNFGIRSSKGEYIIFLDSDDYWDDANFLQILSIYITKLLDVEVINFGWKLYFDKSKKIIKDKRRYSLSKFNSEDVISYFKRLIRYDLYIASACNKCIKRSFIVKHSIYFKTGIRSEDIEWCGRILFHSPIIDCINVSPYVYRQQRVGSITNSVDCKHIQDIINTIRDAHKNIRDLNLPEIYLNYYAVQYLTLLFNISKLDVIENKEIIEETKSLKKLLNFDINYKVKIAKITMKIFGFNLMINLLKKYILFRRK